MTDQPDSDQQDKKKNTKLGTQLLEARKASGWSVADAAERLNLEPGVIDALENDDYQKLPERTFIRGYLVAYIRILGLPETLLKQFDANDEIKDYVPLTSGRAYTTACSRDGWVKCINVGLVALLIVAFAVWLIEQQFHLINPVQDSGTQQASSLQPSVVDETKPTRSTEQDSQVNPLADFTPEEEIGPVLESDVSAESLVAEESSDSESSEQQEGVSVDVEPTEQLDQQPQAIVAADTQDAGEHTLFLKFSDASWTQVKDADNKTLLNGTFPAGDEKLLSGKPPFKLIVGRIRNVTIDYNGKPVDLTPHDPRKVARFSIGENAANTGG
jgi:cytoskeleton protein RodZ